MSDDEKIIISHYKTVGRYGKDLVKEEVKDGSDTARFLQRMELRRLATDCNLALDLRRKVPGDVFAYEYAGMVHHLDEISIETFQNEASKYEGRYTVGVFEAVLNGEHTFKAQHERELAEALEQKKRAEEKKKAPKDPLFLSEDEKAALENQQVNDEQSDSPQTQSTAQAIPKAADEIQLIPFGYRTQRKENRLTYITKVTVTLPDGTELIGKTNDISQTGIRVQLPIGLPHLSRNDVVVVVFNQFEEKYRREFGKVQYRLIAQELDQQRNVHLRLLREEAAENNRFDRFINEFIEAYFLRYKIDLEDNLSTLKAKAYERIYTSSAPIMASFLEVSSETTISHYATTRAEGISEIKKRTFSTICANINRFIDEQGLTQLVDKTSLLLEAFAVKQDDRFLIYCANRHQLSEKGIADEFMQTASACYYVARMQVDCQPVHPSDIQAALSSLENLVDADPVKADQLSQDWQKITHIAYFKVIEDKQLGGSGLTADSEKLTPLGEYQLTSATERIWQLAYRNQRSDPRYLHNTSVELTVDGNTYQGNTLDFSPLGLRVQLDTNSKLLHSLAPLQAVSVALPDLQKLAKKTAKLTALNYRVTQIHPHQGAVSLKRTLGSGKHEGETFIARLIKSNQHKLIECSEDLVVTCISEMLEFLINMHLPGIPLFIGRFPGRRLAIHSAAATENANELLWRFKTDAGFDFSPLNLEHFFAEQIKPKQNRKGQLTEALESRLFAIFPEKEAEVGASLQINPEADMDGTREVARFILQTRRHSHHRILRATLLPPPFIELDEFSEDLKVIRRHSPAKAKEFETSVFEMVAVFNVDDISAFYAS